MSYYSIKKNIIFQQNKRMETNEIKKRLAENLRRIRKSRKMTQFQLAEYSDVSEETIKNIELSRCWTSDKTLEQITKALKIDISFLFMPIDESIERIAYSSKQLDSLKKTISENLLNYIKTALDEITTTWSI